MITETTIHNYNSSIYDLIRPTGTVMYWLRSVVASRMASTARGWVETMARYNRCDALSVCLRVCGLCMCWRLRVTVCVLCVFLLTVRVFIIYSPPSGTYNNQWIVVDYKLFTPGAPLPDNVLWIGEQLPDQFPMADMTPVRVFGSFVAFVSLRPNSVCLRVCRLCPRCAGVAVWLLALINIPTLRCHSKRLTSGYGCGFPSLFCLPRRSSLRDARA